MKKQVLISKLLKELINQFSNGEMIPVPELTYSGTCLVESLKVTLSKERQSSTIIDANCGYVYSHNSINQKMFEIQPISTSDYIQSANWIKLTHPNSMEFILKATTAAFKFFHSLPTERHNEFDFVYQHRLLNKNNCYESFILRFYVLQSKIAANSIQFMLHAKLNPLLAPVDENLYKFISIKPYNLFIKSKLLDSKEYIAFTNTEQEIVKLVNKGLDYNEIAKIRSISPDTVRTHFRNINLKTGMHSIKQSCFYAGHFYMY
jgi:DNA-binding CsgD family transcriptional regulator